VKRVLARYFGVRGFPGEQKIERELWARADACTPTERVAEYTQAIMDLGATVCVRSRPVCAACPQRQACVANRLGLQAELPTPRPKKARPERKAFALLARNRASALLLERRALTGLWGGLWTFPQFESREEALAWAHARFEFDAARVEMLAAYEHAFTHFDLTLTPLVVNVATARVEDDENYAWYDARTPARIGLAKPAVDLIRALNGTRELELPQESAKGAK
jgi:A/G-specific adenine glycosylase